MLKRESLKKFIKLLEALVMRNSAVTARSNKPNCAYDKKRMESALRTDFVHAPKGMTREQMKVFIKYNTGDNT